MKNESAESPKAAVHDAKFDIETPPGSATAADAHSTNPYFSNEEAGVSSKDVDNLATISLDTPSASDGDATFKETEQLETHQSTGEAAGAFEGLAPAATSTFSNISSAGSLPLSASLTQLSTSNSAAADLGVQQQSTAGLQPAQPPAVSTSQPAALPRASHVKVWVKDPEKVAERSRLGVSLGSYINCLVRTECSKTCSLASGAAVVAAAAAADGSSPTAAAAAAGSSDPEGRATAGGQGQQQHQGQQASEGVAVFEVQRRFDDFDALSRLLKGHFRGYFIPRLPPSDWLAGGDNFLRTRKVDLQDYLSQVVNHPVLQGSEELRLFLTAAGDLAGCAPWQRMLQRPTPMDALLGLRRADAPPSSSTSNSEAAAVGSGGAGVSSSAGAGAGAGPAGGGGGWGVMQRMRHSIMNVVQPKVQQEVSAEEQQLRQAKEWFKELQQHLSSCVTVVRSLVSHMEALCEDYGELGRALSHFARFEEAQAHAQGQYTTAGSTAVERGAALQKLGYGALRQHSLSKQSVVTAGASLVFLPDYYALIPECVSTLEEREEALAAVNSLAEQLREKQEAAAKGAAALGPAAEGDKRMVALNATIHALQDKLLAAEQQYRLLKERNQAELVRLNLQRAEDFRRALGRFAALQAQAAAAAADVWSGVAEQFAQE